MTALGGFVAFPVDADILTVVDLTKQQTLALYGTTIQGSYYTGSEWRSCEFEYFGSSAEQYGSDAENGYITNILAYDHTGFTSDGVNSLLRNNEFLFYRCPLPTPAPAGQQSSLQFDLDFSVPISGIAYFRQIVALGIMNPPYRDIDYPYPEDFYITNSVSYSPTPISCTGALNNYRVQSYFQTYIQSITSPAPYHYAESFVFADVYLQDLDPDTGQERTFDISSQNFICSHGVQITLQTIPNSEDYFNYYVIAISTPRVTDGYVLPDVTTDIDYTQQLDDIIAGQSANTTLLQQILAKLDLIYQKMQGGLNPSLTPAQTIPHDLRQYYTNIVTGAPSASKINEYAGGAALIPFSSILSASGLGGLFGLLVGIACAGWVLTRGRGG